MRGKRVLVTGASRGIGAEAVRVFAAAGAEVGAMARDGAALAALAAETGAHALPADVADAGAVARAVADFAAAGDGRIDVAIANAGVIEPIAPIATADAAAWGHAIDVNLKGVFHLVRAVLPGMLARRAGTILAVSSGAAHHPLEGWSAYCAAKAGAAMLTRALHHEVGGQGIRVMGLSPGTVATDMQRAIRASGINPVARIDWSEHVPPEWPARALAWMCTADADDWLGQEISLRDAQVRARVGLPG